MKQKIIYILLFSWLFIGGVNAQIECVNTLDVALDENGEAQFVAADLVPNVEFYIATGTVTYYVAPFISGVINSGNDLININCNTFWTATYIIEFTQNGELIESCSGEINISDPLGVCSNGNYCDDASIDCEKAVSGYTYYSENSYELVAENFAICSQAIDCQGVYGIAIGELSEAENLTYTSTISSNDIVDFVTPIVLSYTENGMTAYDNSIFYAWQNLECFLITKGSHTIELDLTGETTLIPSMFLESENTCNDVQMAITELNGSVPVDFYDNVVLDCEDIGYHTVYLRDNLNGMIGSCQLFLADPLEVCGPILGPGDVLIKMSNDPPAGTYANTKLNVNGMNLQKSPAGKGWIINEDMLVEGTNTLNFDSGPFTLNGISTLDLVRLLRIIIMDDFENPIQSIVMDVDNSGYNGIGDLILTRFLVLGNPAPPEVNNVLFIPKGFQFPSDFSPFDFDYDFTKYEFEKADFNELPFRFDAYKVGDFNGNAVTEDSLTNILTSSSRDLDVFEVSDMEITAGVPFNFTLKYDNGTPIKGLLAALVSNGVKFQSLTSTLGDEVNYNVINDYEIRVSYFSYSFETIDNISFEISAISDKSGSLIDFLGLKSGFPQEVIDENDAVIKIEYLEEATVTSVNDTEVFNDLSIYPNPVHQKLIISIPEGVLGRIDILDPMGRTVLSDNSKSNSLQFDVSELADGLYFVRMKSNLNLSNNSFIKIN